MLLISGLFVQYSAYAQHDSAGTALDSVPSAKGLLDPGADTAAATRVERDIPITTAQRKYSLSDARRRYEHWSDQFPSYLVQRFNGLGVQQAEELPMPGRNEDWRFWFVLVLLAFLAFIRGAYGKDFNELGETFKNWSMNQHVVRELGVGIPLGVVLLNIFSVIAIAFYVFILLQHFALVLISPSWMLMVFSLAGVGAMILLRYLLLKIVELIFPFRKEIRTYIYYEVQINRMLGILLFPLVILISFTIPPLSEAALLVSFLVAAALLTVRYVKGFGVGATYLTTHPIHFLLYLCALEIAPVLIVIRLLLNLGPISIPL